MKPLICFDLDNTLIRSDKAHIEAFVMAFEKYGFKAKKEKIAPLLFGPPSEFIIKKLFPNMPPETVKLLVKEHDDLVIKKTAGLAIPIKDSPKVIKQLRKNFEIAILSNCKYSELKALLKKTGIRDYNIAIGKDQVKHSKPYPDELFKAEKLLKHKAVFMIGDSIYDVMAGKRAGVQVISVLTGHNTKEQLKKVGTDHVVKDISVVPALLNKILIKRS